MSRKSALPVLEFILSTYNLAIVLHTTNHLVFIGMKQNYHILYEAIGWVWDTIPIFKLFSEDTKALLSYLFSLVLFSFMLIALAFNFNIIYL